ncbi:hypothetical protein [Mesorhizobium sp. STM 4661]|uniref:hypothetical protein n=1 Tax=Mesorhizobium sp. STM 4661 TaxID=1297570 RepID=UPI0002BF2941|nr:hypothetical protein [Mesorhizobium sp. STM 4661]CCV12943.1 hypothetical protein MESS4_510110 [Mesorhizobium sp. STM 4661]
MAGTPFHTNVSLAGFHFEDFSLTFKLTAGIVAADVGKAVAISAAAANTVKLAGDGDYIVGRLATVEDRTIEGTLVGAVELKFANTLPIKVGQVVVVGGSVVGAGAGEVKPAGVTDLNANMVVEVVGLVATVVKL